MSEIQIQQTPWNVFDRVMYKDDSTTKYEYAQYQERNITVTGLNTYNLITQDLDLPLFLSDSFIEVECYIKTLANVANDINTGQIALNNNGFNVFQRGQYLINDQLIEDLDEVGTATTVKGLLDYSKGFSENLSSEFWFLDTGLGGNNETSLMAANTLTAVRADGQVLTATTTTAAGLLIFTKIATYTGVAPNVTNGDVVALYYNNVPVQLVKFVAGVESIIAAAAITMTSTGANTGTLTVAASSKWLTNCKLIRIDGTEIFMYGGGAQGILIGNATPNLALTLIGGAANAQTISVNAASFTSSLFNTGFAKRRQKTISTTDNITANLKLVLFLPIRRMFKLFEYNQSIFKNKAGSRPDFI